MSYFSRIMGTGAAFPERVMTNKEFEAFVETSDEWIRTRTGIQTRRISDYTKGESTLKFSREAAEKALKMANLSGADIDLIVVGTVTPESLMPTTANLLQRDLGATRAFSFDLQAACSGFLYGLSIADQYIRSGTITNALVIGAETLSSIVNWQDRSTCILFGDAGGAAVLTRSTDPAHSIASIRTYSDGTKGNVLTLAHGGSHVPVWAKEYNMNQAKIFMAGAEVFKLAVRALIEASEQVLKDAGMAVEEVDFFIFHQANIRIIDMCAKAFRVDPHKMWINVDKYGNTSAATLPICLDEAWRAGKVKPGDSVLMATFGGGVTWGAALVRL